MNTLYWEKLGYEVISKKNLGTFSKNDGLLEIAGLIDKKIKVVEISEKFNIQSKKFTLAHELGHAWHSWLLRDLPLEQRDYPKTLAETASLFAETLVRDALLARHPTLDPQRVELVGHRAVAQIDVIDRALAELQATAAA